jgi:sulfite exporter TauE/SafE
MKVNVGSTERLLRIIAGVVIIGLGLYFQSWWGVIGLVPLLTGLFRFCPLYSMLGINTCKR